MTNEEQKKFADEIMDKVRKDIYSLILTDTDVSNIRVEWRVMSDLKDSNIVSIGSTLI